MVASSSSVAPAPTVTSRRLSSGTRRRQPSVRRAPLPRHAGAKTPHTLRHSCPTAASSSSAGSVSMATLTRQKCGIRRRVPSGPQARWRRHAVTTLRHSCPTAASSSSVAGVSRTSSSRQRSSGSRREMALEQAASRAALCQGPQHLGRGGLCLPRRIARLSRSCRGSYRVAASRRLGCLPRPGSACPALGWPFSCR